MGKLIDGRWHSDEDIRNLSADGAYEREDSLLRHWIDDSKDPPTPGRYHLYVAWNCPWAHRTLLLRAAKGLEQAIPVSVAAPRRNDQGWVFDRDTYCDRLYNAGALHEIYSRAAPGYTGRATVPVLFDTREQRIVSNESADIVRMLNDAFNNLATNKTDYYPTALRGEIDHWNELIYPNINNGVYRAGFAATQAAYEAAVLPLFATLDELEKHLEHSSYLAGDRITEADWRLFPTLARFDVAYYGAFKCNVRQLTDYPNLWRYARDLYHQPGVAATVHFDIYRQGYYSRSEKRNPSGIVPVGPSIDWRLEDERRAPHRKRRATA